MAAQTARGAASLLIRDGSHPEPEIDRVTTPRGCTIAGLNEMEHRGFSSAMIKGIVTSARKAARTVRVEILSPGLCDCTSTLVHWHAPGRPGLTGPGTAL